MKFLKNIKGETIAETIIALTILAVRISMTSMMMANSLRNINFSKNRVIAVNIAREGIEAVRNIRDTNWLKFSGKRRMCWNHMPQALPDDCDGSKLIAPKDYIVYKANDQRWRLKEILPSLDPTFDITELYYVDIDPATDSDGDSDFDSDKDMYNHKTKPDLEVLTDDALGVQTAQPTFYKREIKIEYLDNAGNMVAGIPVDTLNRIKVTSTVTWQENSAVIHKVELKTHLTDYLGREKLDD